MKPEENKHNLWDSLWTSAAHGMSLHELCPAAPQMRALVPGGNPEFTDESIPAQVGQADRVDLIFEGAVASDVHAHIVLGVAAPIAVIDRFK